MPATVDIKIIDAEERTRARPGGNFHPGDFELFDSKKGMEKVRRNLDRLPHHFNITVLVGKRGDMMKLVDEQPKRPDAINVVLCNNVTTEKNWIPMTSWILLHRLSHCFITGHEDIFDASYPRRDGPEFALFAGLDDIWWDAFYGVDKGRPTHHPLTGRSYVPVRNTVQRRLREKPNTKDFTCMDESACATYVGFMASHLFTMRSAREKALSSELDIFAEAFAQFLYTGRFRMNRWEESGITELGHTKNFVKNPRCQMDWGHMGEQDLTKLASPVEILNQRIAEVEAEVNAKMADLAQRMVGHTFSF